MPLGKVKQRIKRHLCTIYGHVWQAVGGRPCANSVFTHPGEMEGCVQTVYQCERCEDFDYGTGFGSIAYEECRRDCPHFRGRNS